MQLKLNATVSSIDELKELLTQIAALDELDIDELNVEYFDSQNARNALRALQRYTRKKDQQTMQANARKIKEAFNCSLNK